MKLWFLFRATKSMVLFSVKIGKCYLLYSSGHQGALKPLFGDVMLFYMVATFLTENCLKPYNKCLIGTFCANLNDFNVERSETILLIKMI